MDKIALIDFINKCERHEKENELLRIKINGLENALSKYRFLHPDTDLGNVDARNIDSQLVYSFIAKSVISGTSQVSLASHDFIDISVGRIRQIVAYYRMFLFCYITGYSYQACKRRWRQNPMTYYKHVDNLDLILNHSANCYANECKAFDQAYKKAKEMRENDL